MQKIFFVLGPIDCFSIGSARRFAANNVQGVDLNFGLPARPDEMEVRESVVTCIETDRATAELMHAGHGVLLAQMYIVQWLHSRNNP